MKCRKCRKTIDDDSNFCKWCGVAAQKESVNIKVPEPKLLPSGSWHIHLRKENVFITEDSYEKCKNKAIAVRQGWVQQEKKCSDSVGKIIDKFLNESCAMLSPSTVRAYRSYRNHRFQSVINQSVSSVNWQLAINRESEKLSPKSVINSWRLITAAMRYSQLTVPNVKLPQQIKKEKQFLDYMQILVLLDGVEKTEQNTRLCILFGLHGLRRSEIYDLKMSDIDLKKQIIKVHGSAVYGEEGLTHKATNKNSTSRREVPIVIPMLSQELEAIKHDDYLVIGDNKNLYRSINSICRKCGLPEVGIHGLRHSAVSLAWHLDWDAITTMKTFGYSNLATVQDIYTHLSEADKNRDIGRMKRYFSDKKQMEKQMN